MKLVITESINGVTVVNEKETTLIISDFDTGAGSVPLSTVTGKGSLIVGTANATVGEFVVGADGTTPIADSTETLGVRWGTPAGSFGATDAENRTLSGTLTLTNTDAYVQYCDPGGVGRDVVLPTEGTGNHPFYIYNSADAAENLTVKNGASAVIGVLHQGDSEIFISNAVAWSALGVGDITGWSSISDSWTYASATTITVPSGATSIYSVGDKIKLTQTTVKYFYVVGVADTLLTVTGGSDYTVANATITSPYYSHQSNPVGFPQYFSYTPTGISASNVSISGRFIVVGKVCSARISVYFTGGITFTTMPTLPIPASSSLLNGFACLAGIGGYYDASPTVFSYGSLYSVVLPSATTVSIHKSDSTTISASVPITWANGDYLEVNFSYEI